MHGSIGSTTAVMTLSPAPQQVVTHRSADLQGVACVGSRKTESISRRIAVRIEEGAEQAASAW
jgi:hypothetical protein